MGEAGDVLITIFVSRRVLNSGGTRSFFFNFIFNQAAVRGYFYMYRMVLNKRCFLYLFFVIHFSFYLNRCIWATHRPQSHINLHRKSCGSVSGVSRGCQDRKALLPLTYTPSPVSQTVPGTWREDSPTSRHPSCPPSLSASPFPFLSSPAFPLFPFHSPPPSPVSSFPLFLSLPLIIDRLLNGPYRMAGKK